MCGYFDCRFPSASFWQKYTLVTCELCAMYSNHIICHWGRCKKWLLILTWAQIHTTPTCMWKVGSARRRQRLINPQDAHFSSFDVQPFRHRGDYLSCWEPFNQNAPPRKRRVCWSRVNLIMRLLVSGFLIITLRPRKTNAPTAINANEPTSLDCNERLTVCAPKRVKLVTIMCVAINIKCVWA